MMFIMASFLLILRCLWATINMLVRGLLDTIIKTCLPTVALIHTINIYCRVRDDGFDHDGAHAIMLRYTQRNEFRKRQMMLDQAREFITKSFRQAKHNRMRANFGLPAAVGLDNHED